MDRSFPAIQKNGTFDCDIIEANPIVWQGRLLIGEYIRYGRDRTGIPDSHPSKSYYAVDADFSYFRFYEPATGKYFGKIAPGLHMGNAFVDGDRIVVISVEKWGGSKYYLTESTDLIHWTEPRVIIDNPAFAGFNNSVCKTPDGWMMLFELLKPEDLVGVPFTMFFAFSKDLQDWQVLPDVCFGKDHYTGGPMLRYFAEYYYVFYLNITPENTYETCVARSTDLKNWQYRPEPVLSYGEKDKIFAPDFPMAKAAEVQAAQDINASDLDMCDYNGNLELIYSWGNQHGTEFLARAQVPGMTEQEFCESLFA